MQLKLRLLRLGIRDGGTMKSWILGGLTIAAISGICHAEERVRAVKPSEWRSRPTAEIAARYYPEKAQRMNISGRTILNCRVTTEGKLEDCKVLLDLPADYRFGEQAIKLTKFMELDPPTKKDLRKNIVRRTIPMNFTVPAY